MLEPGLPTHCTAANGFGSTVKRQLDPLFESHSVQLEPAPVKLLNHTSAEVAPFGKSKVKGTLFADELLGTPDGESKPRTEPLTSSPPGENFTKATTSHAGKPLCVPRQFGRRSSA